MCDERRACFYCDRPFTERQRREGRVCCNACHRSRAMGTAKKPRRVACELTLALASEGRAYVELPNVALRALRRTDCAAMRDSYVHVVAVRGRAAMCVVTVPDAGGGAS